MNIKIKIQPKDIPLKREYVSFLVRQDFRIQKHTWCNFNNIEKISLVGNKNNFVSWINFDKEG